MRGSTVEQLLRELEQNRVAPERYARRSLSARLAPVVGLLLLAVMVTTSGVVLGRL
jgi:hypothetical protein